MYYTTTVKYERRWRMNEWMGLERVREIETERERMCIYIVVVDQLWSHAPLDTSWDKHKMLNSNLCSGFLCGKYYKLLLYAVHVVLEAAASWLVHGSRRPMLDSSILGCSWLLAAAAAAVETWGWETIFCSQEKYIQWPKVHYGAS